MTILISILIIGALGLFFGAFLAFASQKFEVVLDPRIETVLEALPGANCGSCGYPGCAGYAEAIVNEKAAYNLCPPGGSDTAIAVSDIMGGDDIVYNEKIVALVACQGNNAKTTKKYKLDTDIKTCGEAMLYFFGDKSCAYGCLGYGDCVRHCPFGAIEITEQGIAKVNIDKCVGCGLCVKTCPKKIIKLYPSSKQVQVLCASKDKGLEAKSVCEIACISCGICAKSCPVGAIKLVDNRAEIDYDLCVNCGICALKCPTNAINSDIKDSTKATIDVEKCIGCTLCKKACPVDAISGELRGKHCIDTTTCVGCGLCVEKCPKNAIELKN